MKLTITKCSNPSFWYSDCIGMTFKVICYYTEDGVFLVRDKEGYLNIINKNDAEITED